MTDGVTLALSGVRGGFLGARWTRVGHTCRTGARGALLRHDSQPWPVQPSLGVKIVDLGVRNVLISDLMSKTDLLLEGDSKAVPPPGGANEGGGIGRGCRQTRNED